MDDLCIHVVSDELLCNCNYDPHRRGGLEGVHQPLPKLRPCACDFSAHEAESLEKSHHLFLSHKWWNVLTERVTRFLLFIVRSLRPTCLVLARNETLRLYLIDCWGAIEAPQA